jgi:hypothetical protein
VVQRTICGHLAEEMTERYSSVAQVEVQPALGKVVSLAGYRDLLTETAKWCEGGPERRRAARRPWKHPKALSFSERDIGFEPTTFSLGS